MAKVKERLGKVLFGGHDKSQILLFLSEVYLGYHFWLLTQYYNMQIYWSILKIAAGSVIAYVGVAGYFVPIFFLYIAPLRRLVQRFRNAIRIVPAAILIISLVPNDIVRFVLLFISIVALTFSTYGIHEVGSKQNISKRKFERFQKGALYGLFLLPVLRNVGFKGIHPFQYHPAATAVHTAIALLCIGVILYYEREEDELLRDIEMKALESSVEPPISRPTFHVAMEFIFAIANGVSFGLITHLNFWIFTSFEYIPRWTYVNPYPIDILVFRNFPVIFQILFIFLASVTVIPQLNFSHILSWILMLVGIGLFCHTSEGLAFFGGILMLISMPSFWLTTTQEISETSPKLRVTSFVFGWLMYILCLYGGLGMMADVPVFGGIGQKPYYLLWFTGVFMGGSLIIHNARKYIGDDASAKDLISSKLKRPSRPDFYGIFLLVVMAIISITVNGVQHRFEYRSNVWTDRLAVFSWNVLQGYDLKGNLNYDEITTVIKQYQPDVIALQETNSLHQLAGARDMIAYLSENLQLEGYQGAPTSKYADGSSLLSAYKMNDMKYEILPTPETRWGRALTSAKIRFNNTDITVISTHLESVLFSNRIAQVNTIADRIKEISEWFGCYGDVEGDFNAGPTSEEISVILNAGMTMANINPTDDTIDFIFYRNLRITLFDRIEKSDINGASDHPAVLAHFATM